MRVKIRKDYALILFFILFILMQIKLQRLRGLLAICFLIYYVIKKRSISIRGIKKKPTYLVVFILVYGLLITAVNSLLGNLNESSYFCDYYINLFVIVGCSLFLIVGYLNFECFCFEIRNIGWVIYSFGIIERITRYNITANYIIYEYRKYLPVYGRIYSIFNHPVGYGVFLSMMAIIVYYYPFKKPSVNVVYGLLLFINMVLTGTRSSITALVIVFIIIFIKSKIVDNKNVLEKLTRLKYIIPIILLSVTSVVILTLFKNRIQEFTNAYFSRFKMGFSGSDQGIRIGVVLNYLKHLKSCSLLNTIFGNGIGYADTVFMKNYRILTGYDRSVVWDGTTDNMYITIALDLGIIGLIAFAILFLYAIIVFFQSKDNENRSLSVSCILLVLLGIELIVFEGLFWSLCFFQFVIAIAIMSKNPYQYKS